MALVFAPGPAAAEVVGEVVKAQMDSFQARGARGAPLGADEPVFRDARVYTNDYGTIQILLADGTDLLISPNSSIVLDEYVYGGDPGAARFSLRLAEGALRMISGRMPDEAYLARTEVAHVGVRGTRFWLDVDEPGLTKIWADDGAVEARPVNSDEEYLFEAPVYAECDDVACKITEAPPKPVKFPLDPRGKW